MRAIATSPAGGVGWPLGAPTQPSARTTQGSYFNRNGVLKFAPPGVLRPNYVYKNGVWVLDGYLKERASENYCSNVTDTFASQYFPSAIIVKKDEVISPRINGVPSATQTNIFSVYIVTADPRTTATYCDYWWGGSGSDGGTLDLGARELKNASGGYNELLSDYGYSLRLSLTGGPLHADIWDGLIIPRNGDVVCACFQLEKDTGDHKPTSWIPYGQTRTSD